MTQGKRLMKVKAKNTEAPDVNMWLTNTTFLATIDVLYLELLRDLKSNLQSVNSKRH